MVSVVDADSAAPPAWFTAALAAPVTQRTTMVADVPIAYRMWGSSPNGRGIVLVHGGAANSRWWDHIGPLLAADRSVIAIDLSGTATAAAVSHTALTPGRARYSPSPRTPGSMRPSL